MYVWTPTARQVTSLRAVIIFTPPLLLTQNQSPRSASALSSAPAALRATALTSSAALDLTFPHEHGLALAKLSSCLGLSQNLSDCL